MLISRLKHKILRNKNNKETTQNFSGPLNFVTEIWPLEIAWFDLNFNFPTKNVGYRSMAMNLLKLEISEWRETCNLQINCFK